MLLLLLVLWLVDGQHAPHLLVSWLVTIGLCVAIARQLRWCSWIKPDLAGFLFGFLGHGLGVVILLLAWLFQDLDESRPRFG